DNVHQLAVVPRSDRELQPSGIPVHPVDRQLATLVKKFRFAGFVVDISAGTTVEVDLIFGSHDTTVRDRTLAIVEVDLDGNGKGDADVEDIFLKDDKPGLCDTCTVVATAGNCQDGPCEGYDEESTNSIIDPRCLRRTGTF
ncbi:unnamed protein product, partial [Laminaria digitata]